jgi:hypothetical protein
LLLSGETETAGTRELESPRGRFASVHDLVCAVGTGGKADEVAAAGGAAAAGLIAEAYKSLFAFADAISERVPVLSVSPACPWPKDMFSTEGRNGFDLKAP